MRYRLVTFDSATDYDDGVEAAVKHCRNVASNVTSLLLRRLPRYDRPHKLDLIGVALIVAPHSHRSDSLVV